MNDDGGQNSRFDSLGEDALTMVSVDFFDFEPLCRCDSNACVRDSV